jgi:hypothetical protein
MELYHHAPGLHSRTEREHGLDPQSRVWQVF